MPNFLVSTNSSDSEYNADCDYAIIELEQWLLEDLLERRARFKKLKEYDDRLFEIVYWDNGTAEFISEEEVEKLHDYIPDGMSMDEFQDELAQGKPIFLKEGFSVAPERTTMHTMHISENCMEWKCVPKHTTITIETDSVFFDRLTEHARLNSQVFDILLETEY
jgi:hypothetical protein